MIAIATISPARAELLEAGQEQPALDAGAAAVAGAGLIVDAGGLPPPLDAGVAPPAGEEELSAVGSLEAIVQGSLSRDPIAEAVAGKQAAEEAGAHGDALIAAQALPGVARPPLGSGQISVWGAAPEETALLIDGIEVPALFHLGGYRSVVPSEMISRFELHPAAFGAEYGRALGGVLDVELEPPGEDRSGDSQDGTRRDSHALLAIDPLDAHAAAWTRAGAARVYAGARYSLIDRTLAPLLSDDARALTPLPRSFDAQAVAALPLRDGETLELIALGSTDAEARSLNLEDSAVARGDLQALRWTRLGARWRRALTQGAKMETLLWLGDELQTARLFYGAAFARQTRWAQSGGLRSAWSTPVRGLEESELSLGVDARVTHTTVERAGALTEPPREGDVTAFGEPLPGEVAFDRWRTLGVDAAVFAEWRATFAGRWDLAAGLRASGDTSDVSRVTPKAGLTPQVGLSQLEWFAEPRLSLVFRESERLRLFAAAGLHHQPPDPLDLSAVFGAPTLGSSRALHALLGAGARLHPRVSLELTGFLRELGELPVRSALSTPLLAQALAQSGSGQVFGGQLGARLDRSGPLSAFVSAQLSRSTRTDQPGEPARLFDQDQPLVLTAALEWKPEDATQLSARLRYASGAPRTPVIGAYVDSQSGLWMPIFGAQNSLRLPAFAELDLRAAHRFPLGRAGSLQLSLDVLNATDRQNAEELVYSADWTSRGFLTGLPIAALLGLQWTL